MHLRGRMLSWLENFLFVYNTDDILLAITLLSSLVPIWEPLTTADVTTADSTANVSTADVLVLGYGLWVRVWVVVRVRVWVRP